MTSTDRERYMRECAATYAASFELEYEIRKQERAEERKYWQEVTLPAILARAERNRFLATITNHTKGVRYGIHE